MTAHTVLQAYSNLLRVSDAATSKEQRLLAMKAFAEELEWVPSYEVQGSFGVSPVVGHLIVEHGLENAAAISFLEAPWRTADLGVDQLRALLAISYNNLIEWHLFVSGHDVRWINNLADRSLERGADRLHAVDAAQIARFASSERLDQMERFEGPRRSLKSCDDALLQVVARWKRLLKADYERVENRNLSALFNALILVRGCEDRDLDRAPGASRLLLQTLFEGQSDLVDLAGLLQRAFAQVGVESELSDFVEEAALAPFRSVDRATAFNLLHDLYTPRDAPYEFNFALMSKHALSRIYEKYVSILSPDEDQDEMQLAFVPSVPKSAVPTKAGAIYTPQFVAGFFARYLRENMTPRTFRELRSIDPACGSGLFLRTLLELQCDPFTPGVTSASVLRAFSLAEGIDRDENACEATRLSLALLYLIATGSLPRALDIRVRTDDAIEAALEGRLERESFGAVLTNPPYVKLDHLSQDERELYRRYLGDVNLGRVDAYVPFVNLCLDLVEPSGFVCLVLPQVFLTAVNARRLRSRISEEFDVLCLVDLTAVPVFEGVGTYTILLIAQRRANGQVGPAAQVAQITEAVGPALQACLQGRTVRNRYHNVFPIAQRFFTAKDWVLVTPEQLQINDRLESLPRLSSFMTVAQGFVTGADGVFIRPKKEIPRSEESAYADFLPDRQIGRYRIPKRSDKVVFLPYDRGRPLSEDELAERFPQTWEYLLGNRESLSKRRSVESGDTPWWRPVRPRDPAILLRPKIVCPHLMLTPRFAVDALGKFAVSHSPFIVAKEEGEQHALVRFFCAVLNSSVCNWYIRTYAPKYRRGYNRLEVNLLSSVPVPDLGDVSAGSLNSIANSVDKLLVSEDVGLVEEVDALICSLYGFTASERGEYFGLDLE